MDWSKFLIESVRLDQPYYAIRCSQIRVYDIKDKNMPMLNLAMIQGKYESIDLVEPQSGELVRLLNRVLDLGKKLWTTYRGWDHLQLVTDPDITREITDMCREFGMLYPEMDDNRLPRHIIDLYERAGIPMPPSKIECSLDKLVTQIIRMSLIFECLIALNGSREISHSLIADWDDTKTQSENIVRALAIELSNACDAAVHFEFSVGADGMPRSRAVYENPFDAIFGIIGRAFVTAPDKIYHTAVCRRCGNIFAAKTKRAQYCSERCKKAVKRARKKLREGNTNNVKTETQGE